MLVQASEKKVVMELTISKTSEPSFSKNAFQAFTTFITVSRIPNQLPFHAAYKRAIAATTPTMMSPTGQRAAAIPAIPETAAPPTEAIAEKAPAIVVNIVRIGHKTNPTAPTAKTRPPRTATTAPIPVIIS